MCIKEALCVFRSTLKQALSSCLNLISKLFLGRSLPSASADGTIKAFEGFSQNTRYKYFAGRIYNIANPDQRRL